MSITVLFIKGSGRLQNCLNKYFKYLEFRPFTWKTEAKKFLCYVTTKKTFY